MHRISLYQYHQKLSLFPHKCNQVAMKKVPNIWKLLKWVGYNVCIDFNVIMLNCFNTLAPNSIFVGEHASQDSYRNKRMIVINFKKITSISYQDISQLHIIYDRGSN